MWQARPRGAQAFFSLSVVNLAVRGILVLPLQPPVCKRYDFVDGVLQLPVGHIDRASIRLPHAFEDEHLGNAVVVEALVLRRAFAPVPIA